MENLNIQPLLDRLTHVAKKTGALKDFADQKTLVDKLEFCWKTSVKYDGDVEVNFRKEIKQILEALYGLSSTNGKSETLALEAKEKGCKAYLKKKDNDAHYSFNECLKRAPEHSSIVPLAYGNRSAVLFQMKRYEESLQDMDRAEKNGYPSTGLHKILARRCSCYVMLGNKNQAEEVFNLYKKCIENIPNDTKEKCEKTVMDLEKKIKSMSTLEIKENKELEEIPPIFKGESLTTKYMTSAFEMSVSDSYGRHVIATEQVSKGSVVFVEKPYAAILLPEHRNTHCHNCFTPVKNPVPCQTCWDAVFCQEDCREKANLWHQYECGILHILSAVGIAHLALRVILITGWELYYKIRHEDDKGRTPGVNSDNVYNDKNHDDGYRAVYNLMPHLDKGFPEDQLQYCFMALLLASVVHDKTKFSKTKDSECDEKPDLVDLASAIVRHIAQLVSNAHAITQIMADGTGGETSSEAISQKRIASAIYPTASLMNHSCKPTIINSFIKDALVIRTIEDVQKGDQIYNCYGPHYCRQTFQERQEALRLQYFFTCKCGPCSQPEFKLKEAAWNGFHCESCGGTSSWTGEDQANDGGNDQGHLVCLECRKVEKPSQKFVQTCTKVNALDEEAQDALRKGDLSTAAMNLKNAIKLGSKVYLSENHYLITLKDMLAKVLGDSGDFVGCSQNLKDCLQAVESRYGKDSIELAHELLKFSGVLELAASNTDRYNYELKEVTTRTDEIFTLNYGPHWKKYLKV